MCGLSSRLEYVGCTQENLAKSSLPMPNSFCWRVHDGLGRFSLTGKARLISPDTCLARCQRSPPEIGVYKRHLQNLGLERLEQPAVQITTLTNTRETCLDMQITTPADMRQMLVEELDAIPQ
ncbi:hypothetical protein XENOCAPTIV_028582 [Xenoophorus captivus]|uniref:Uncharacterized protein n=1 Tax=Xenoophorus captivus TaxID=1517983 RepID=A0ABV0S137_9TELE